MLHRRRVLSKPAVMALLTLVVAAAAWAGKPQTDSERLDRIHRLFKRSKFFFFRKVPEMTVDELLVARRQRPIVLLDSRSPAERAVSTIPGAVGKDELDAARAAMPEATVVVYCTIGHRSGIVASRMRRHGVDAVNLVGGVLAWAHAGQSFTDDGEPTRTVHVYGRRWSLLPHDYVATW